MIRMEDRARNNISGGVAVFGQANSVQSEEPKSDSLYGETTKRQDHVQAEIKS